MEAIAWLTLEMDRSDLLLAMAFHLDQWSDAPHASGAPVGAARTEGTQDMRSDARELLELNEYLARASQAAASRMGAAPLGARTDWLNLRGVPARMARYRHPAHTSSPRRV